MVKMCSLARTVSLSFLVSVVEVDGGVGGGGGRGEVEKLLDP